jgi:hypothetical protein
VQQTAACNAMHDRQNQMCKMAVANERSSWRWSAVHAKKFIAQMMGVRRTNVTEVACDKQRAGLISYVRGRLHRGHRSSARTTLRMSRRYPLALRFDL